MTDHPNFTPEVAVRYERNLRSAADFVVEALNYDTAMKAHGRARAHFAAAVKTISETFLVDLDTVAADAREVVVTAVRPDQVGDAWNLVTDIVRSRENATSTGDLRHD